MEAKKKKQITIITPLLNEEENVRIFYDKTSSAVQKIPDCKFLFMYVDDGNTEAVVYFKKGAKVDKSKFLEGENVEVTGVLEQTKSGWQIWPRGQDDLVSLGLSEDLLKKQALQSNSAGSSEKYLTATAGGFITLVFGFLLRGRGALLKKAGLILVGFIKKNKA